MRARARVSVRAHTTLCVRVCTCTCVRACPYERQCARACTVRALPIRKHACLANAHLDLGLQALQRNDALVTPLLALLHLSATACVVSCAPRASVRVGVCARACSHAHVRLRVCVCVAECVRACVRVCVCVCVCMPRRSSLPFTRACAPCTAHEYTRRTVWPSAGSSRGTAQNIAATSAAVRSSDAPCAATGRQTAAKSQRNHSRRVGTTAAVRHVLRHDTMSC